MQQLSIQMYLVVFVKLCYSTYKAVTVNGRDVEKVAGHPEIKPEYVGRSTSNRQHYIHADNHAFHCDNDLTFFSLQQGNHFAQAALCNYRGFVLGTAYVFPLRFSLPYFRFFVLTSTLPRVLLCESSIITK
ncbi:hypothetical protein WUBG_01381 [Wuchereria bancrofti]|uniref:Uncharacterized protein n=1 Tax=Wuchereria bancrofti TaxID=6293 RepID=J9EYN3_WUCBA|nr:hypothetical protein WUBG_01381 [Wuchereria bancrofti]